MGQTRDEIDQNLAERLCWQAARRDDTRVARRLYRKEVVDGVYQLDAGALLDDFFYFLQELGVGDWLGDVQGTAVQREMVPFVQYVRLSSVKTWFGIESMPAVPALLFSDEALMRLVGFNTHQVRHGVCQRGAGRRQEPRTTGPICPEALADTIVQLNLRDLEALFNSGIRALAKAGVLAAKVTGIVDATDLETTAQDAGCGQVTRQRKITDKRGQVHEIEVTVYGWKLIVLIEARTKIPLAATVVPFQEHETLSLRALITQARANLAGHVRLHKVVFDTGFLDGVDGQGKMAWSERLETEVVGITGLTTYDQYGTPEHGRHHHRRDFYPNPINAVVVRQWHGRDYGPGGNTVFLTNAPVDKPLQPFDDYADRSLIENCDIKESKQPWSLKHPPQKTARAVHVHVLFTLLLFALGTAYRLQCEQEATGREPVGWQRWRRQLLEHTRDHVIVFAQDCYGICHMAEYSLLLGVKLKDRPPGIGTHQDILAKYELPAHD
jgi:Transposase DDE domain